MVSGIVGPHVNMANYPSARRDESFNEDLHGVKVPDPYRWLEDPDSEETAAFVKAQNELSKPFLSSCSVRNKFHERFIAQCVEHFFF